METHKLREAAVHKRPTKFSLFDPSEIKAMGAVFSICCFIAALIALIVGFGYASDPRYYDVGPFNSIVVGLACITLVPILIVIGAHILRNSLKR